jgi:hypothetical protein
MESESTTVGRDVTDSLLFRAADCTMIAHEPERARRPKSTETSQEAISFTHAIDGKAITRRKPALRLHCPGTPGIPSL